VWARPPSRKYGTLIKAVYICKSLFSSHCSLEIKVSFEQLISSNHHSAEGGKVERLPSSNCKELNDEMEKENDDILLQSYI
jgi:hypothetical protein